MLCIARNQPRFHFHLRDSLPHCQFISVVPPSRPRRRPSLGSGLQALRQYCVAISGFHPLSFPKSFPLRAFLKISIKMAQQQQQPPPTGQPADVTQRSGDVNMRKAAAKEDLAFLTSGAKEKRDKVLVGMKGAGHILTHPFNKEAKEEAIAKTIQEKNEIADKQWSIRTTAHMQLLQEKAAADGFDVRNGSVPASAVSLAQQPENGDGSHSSAPGPNSQQLETDVTAASGHGDVVSGDQNSEDSSDGSSRGRARALAQIPPDSQDYQSG